MQNEKEHNPAQPTLNGKADQSKAPVLRTKASEAGTYTGLFAAGLILGILLSWGWGAIRTPHTVAVKQTSTEASDDNTALSAGATENSAQTSSSLTVGSPQKAGDTVIIANAAVDRPTWVVVYEENGGKPGNALGALLLDSSAKNAAIELLRDTTPGHQYLVGESIDNGSHIFSLKDAQVTENGQVLWVAFTAQ